jgi:type IV pilus assembly PilX-like protein
MRIQRSKSARGGRERGAALVIAILVLSMLTVIGIALMLITSTESRISANEWSVNRAFYSSDAGIRWATAEMTDPVPFEQRSEFTVPFGTVLFQMSSHRHSGGTFFAGPNNDIQVTLEKPTLVGRRFFPGGIINEEAERAQYIYQFEARSRSGQNDPLLQYSKNLVADVEVGPLPARLPF